MVSLKPAALSCSYSLQQIHEAQLPQLTQARLRSVKDRIALNMIKRAEEQGLINPETTTLVEPTSGQGPRQYGTGVAKVTIKCAQADS